ncbi:sulfate transport system substrate-binding protein [Pseudochelatococcus lubricantis]|uniref:Sulfate transport system substrate-binding protein n=1 Tax=Pseudochelatococcus lubricantis TaxID=1538102 RepID=A0ABX0UWN3_9HYPH|nr:sulfate ABC transporter substrate-binding protein [Pseudochelatococcus lubricantis]NIJ57349.1 sulfate transport system substrate-binding protein [Pseudochelatococcus lubricantis]
MASAAAVVLAGLAGAAPAQAQTTLLNVSYDPTRELYRQINEVFQAKWKKDTGEDVVVRTSHGGSGGQANKVIEGLEADVVTLGIASDIDLIARETGLIPKDWREKLPNHGLPYTSTVVFVVRKGNPKNIRNWDDLVRDDVKIITPNPKTSAGGRWNFLSAWGFVLDHGGDDAKAREFVTKFYKNVPVLDPGARGSTISFAQRDLGDVLPAWENEAHLILSEFGAEKFDIVVPPFSISAEPPVALVVGNVDKKGTRKAAEAYLDFLYSPEAQTIIAKNWYRPSRPETVAAGGVPEFQKLKLFRAEDKFGDWATIQKRFFGESSVFDEISKAIAQK